MPGAYSRRCSVLLPGISARPLPIQSPTRTHPLPAPSSHPCCALDSATTSCFWLISRHRSLRQSQPRRRDFFSQFLVRAARSDNAFGARRSSRDGAGAGSGPGGSVIRSCCISMDLRWALSTFYQLTPPACPSGTELHALCRLEPRKTHDPYYYCLAALANVCIVVVRTPC